MLVISRHDDISDVMQSSHWVMVAEYELFRFKLRREHGKKIWHSDHEHTFECMVA